MDKQKIRWTTEHDNFLISTHKKEHGSWVRIAKKMCKQFPLVRRTPKACGQRLYVLNFSSDHKLLSRGYWQRWTKEQESILINCRNQNMPFKRIARVVSKAGGKRSASACESHYLVLKQQAKQANGVKQQTNGAQRGVVDNYIPAFLVELALERKWSFEKVKILNDLYKLGNLLEKCTKKGCIEILDSLPFGFITHEGEIVEA